MRTRDGRLVVCKWRMGMNFETEVIFYSLLFMGTLRKVRLREIPKDME